MNRSTPLAAGIALLMLATALPANAYHSTNNTWTQTNADAVILCESKGPFDGFNTAPAAHGGLGGLCYMTATPGTCTDNPENATIPDEIEQPGATCTPPLSVPSGCATFTIHEEGSRLGGDLVSGDVIEDLLFPLVNGVLTAVYDIINSNSTANSIVNLTAEDSPEETNTTEDRTADFQYQSGALFGNAEDDGVCINCNYSLLTDNGHVSAFLGTLVLEFHISIPAGGVPIAIDLGLDELILPGDQGFYSATGCGDPPGGWCDDSADAFGNPAKLAYLDEEVGSDGLCDPSDFVVL
jgi:hypothetical protein